MGPYAIVRHPSYAGLLVLLLGTTMVVGGRGTWTREVIFTDVTDTTIGRGTGQCIRDVGAPIRSARVERLEQGQSPANAGIDRPLDY
jgi:hypothetical protein